MNQSKDKQKHIILIISVSLILCGFLMIPLSKSANEFPHDIWTNLTILMTMAGGGGIGAVISYELVSRRRKRKRVLPQSCHSNCLRKKAWTDFCVVCATAVVGPLMYGFMTYADIKGTQGAGYLLTCLAVLGLGFGAMIWLNTGKHENRNHCDYDEREFHLLHRAINIANHTFICYTLFVMTSAFYVIGGRGMGPMWSIPLALFGGLLIAGTVQFLVLMHYAKEDDIKTEGGPA